MSIPINIEDLLHKRKIESNRIELKTGWNPDKIYRTICALALIECQDSAKTSGYVLTEKGKSFMKHLKNS